MSTSTTRSDITTTNNIALPPTTTASANNITIPPTTAATKAMKYFDLELPSWLPEDKKRDIIDLQIKTFNSPKGRVRRPRIRKRDPGHIPRPMNSFLSYRTEQQLFIRKYCPGANHREISKIVAKWWHELDDKGKELYRDLANSAKEQHAERYPDYKFTPKKKKIRASTSTTEPEFKTMMKSNDMTKEEILYTNIHETDYFSPKEVSNSQNSNAYSQPSIDPSILATAATAAGITQIENTNQPSFQDYFTSMFPVTDQKSLKLLAPYNFQEFNNMPVVFPNATVNPAQVQMEVDPTLFPTSYCEIQTSPSDASASQFTPALGYDESPIEPCLTSPSVSFQTNFQLNDAYNYGYTDSKDLLWNY